MLSRARVSVQRVVCADGNDARYAYIAENCVRLNKVVPINVM